jgi:hypothetical protein
MDAMKLERHDEVAQRVLREVRKRGRELRGTVSLRLMSNGREQGIVLSVGYGDLPAIGFCEGRSSDDIVVYVGQFDLNGVPDDRTYELRRVYPAGEYERAAREVVFQLRRGLRKYAQQLREVA